MKEMVVIKTNHFPRELVEKMYRDTKNNEDKRPKPKRKGA